MISNTENIEPVPAFLDVVDEDTLKQIVYGLPIDPRQKKIVLTSVIDENKWVLPKFEIASHKNQEPDVHREIYEQVGVRGQIVGLVGSFYKCGKNGKPKSHIKIYELQVDEWIEKWPQKKKRNREWFEYQDVSKILAGKPYLIESLKKTCLANTTVVDGSTKPITPKIDPKAPTKKSKKK